MHLIAISQLREVAAKYPDVSVQIEDWYTLVKAATWHLTEVQQSYASAEAVGNFTVFNIKGNRYRLIVGINYVKQTIYFKYFLTHAEYDKDEWKMTLTFNAEVYANLLKEALPRAICTTEEYERVLSIIEALMYKEHLTLEEDQIYDLLIILIEKFEAENYPFQKLSTPHSRLLHLIEANNLKQTDLLDVFGSSGIASEVINGKREISKTHAKKLGARFNIAPNVFLA